MDALKEREAGVMFWAGGDPAATLREVKGLGVRCGQLGIPGGYQIGGQEGTWRAAIEEERFTIVTVFCSFEGESYADISTVRRTVGFMPPETRPERERRTLEVSDFAASIGVRSIGCHIGVLPEDSGDPAYISVLGVVRRICDHAAKHGQTFALETGQEPADALLRFLRDAGRSNLGINFDPANMILYGTGDPIQALGMLGPHVISVHCKDGTWPDKASKDALGLETPLGDGAVGIPLFLEKLKQVGFAGPLNIERECEDRDQWAADVRSAVALLRTLEG